MVPAENQLESVTTQPDESSWHIEEKDAGAAFVADLFSNRVIGWIEEQLPPASTEPARRAA